MTKNEAYKIANGVQRVGTFAENIVDVVEALGLIEFDEEKKVPPAASIAFLALSENL